MAEKKNIISVLPVGCPATLITGSIAAPVYDKEIQADLKRIVCYGYRDTAKGRIVDGTGENRPWENRPSTLCKNFTPALAEAETATVVFRSQEELYRKYKNIL